MFRSKKNSNENNTKKLYAGEVRPMSRVPRRIGRWREAIPIPKVRGIVQPVLSGPEQVFDIAIISKVPVAFTRVMFAP